MSNHHQKKIVLKKANYLKNRSSEGAFQILVCRHLHCNDEKFRQYFRLTPVLFDYVLNNIRDELTSNRTTGTKAYMPRRKAMHSCEYCQHQQWVNFKSCTAIFYKWNFPNCIGAIDGKHIRIKAPKNSGSLFYNYKDYHSMVMLAVVDADCKFTAVDVGSYGREGDAGIYLKSEIGQRIKNNTFNIPPPKALPGTDTVIPHVIVGDEAFALHQNLMKPYPRQQSLHDASKSNL
ncbi:DDE Tnp4 domain-containing protein [Trichonephila clavipes]|nr:DDE Tnp4 domain-containing protein [Trichonephila clavipes]